MDVKQIQLENLVVSYFNQREDTSARPIMGGRYKVKLLSDVARTDFGRGLSDELLLIFDTEDAYNYKDAELITSNHPLLDVIRNDLEKHEDKDPRISEAYLPLQLVNAYGIIAIPKLDLSNLKEHELSLDISFDPYYVFTYRVIYEMDGGSENIVKITVNGVTGEEAQDLLPKLNDNLLISGRPDMKKNEKSEISLRQIQGLSKEIIELRVISDLKLLEENITVQLQRESKRINEYYDNEINRLKDEIHLFQITDLENARSRELNEWKEKLAYQINIEPLSILKLWLPKVDYELSIQSSREEYLISQIVYSSDLDQTNFHKCKKCGNITKFNICLVGKHPACADICGEKVKTCKSCQDDFCEKHGRDCFSCKEPICTKDSRKCVYGLHSIEERFCPDCITESFEKKPLCSVCKDTCNICERNFPHELMSVCRIGSEHICFGHDKKPDGFKCTECGEYTCSNHGSLIEGEKWACADHQGLSSCCGKNYGISALETCVVCKKTVCSEHRSTCSICRTGIICTSHIENQPVCLSCGNWSCGHRGCSSNLHQCKACHMAYCRNCLSSRNYCVTCEGLSVLPDPTSWINFLTPFSRSIVGENGRVLQEILQSRDKLTLWASTNKTYSVVVVRYSRRFYEVWKQNQQFRIVVVKGDGKLVKIHREKTA